ncbi:hypothetical protein DFJ58DRAFT_734065 [Suillus subalutaceus]|uniref:uncharacterized protein n=1 Tax=Suillus subalutaceus TaxID=48586 RepID=UPI001B87284C|nr:uncharacterized protein DFJ58DRAFT_734065 [Suillus subalutaceus]KAG1837967.1 hypothetical protein DFJ58DRAFT_734065 [Suillus subalutaceus]
MASSLAGLSSNLASPHSFSESLLDEVFFTPKSSQSSQSLVFCPLSLPKPPVQLGHIGLIGSLLSETPTARTVLGGTNREAWVFNSRMTSNLAVAVPAEDKENEQTRRCDFPDIFYILQETSQTTGVLRSHSSLEDPSLNPKDLLVASTCP